MYSPVNSKTPRRYNILIWPISASKVKIRLLLRKLRKSLFSLLCWVLFEFIIGTPEDPGFIISAFQGIF